MKQHKLAAAISLAAALSISGAAFAAQPDPNRVWVKFKPGASAQTEQALQAAGGKVHHRFDDLRAFAVTVPEQAMQGLRNNPNIEYIESDAARYPAGQVTPYGIDSIQARDTVATGADGSGIKVCVIDSGINAGHEEFAGISMTGSPSGWDTDTCGHGTHVAGTIAAADNSAGVVGVSPAKVSMHIVQVFDGETCGWSYSSDLIDAANECADAGAKVINMSLGGSFSSTTEDAGFANLDSQGVLSIAAAGNDGNNRKSYPASYDSVMSVAAVDSNNVKADFSQYNDQVEIAAPGVGVLSTYPFRDASVEAGNESFIASALEGSIEDTASASLVDGGLCDSAGSWGGQVVLCERGEIAFADKVSNVQAGGGVAAIVYNNEPGGFAGTLGNMTSTVPAVSLSQEDGQHLQASYMGLSVGVSTVFESDTDGYAYLDGTSMASPHVAGAAAIIWSADPSASNQAVRDAMNGTALDLGAAGRDNDYGHGLVQTFDATEALLNGGGGGEDPDPEPVDPPSGLTATNYGTAKGKVNVGLDWTGGAVTVDVYRDGGKIASAISNTGEYDDQAKKNSSLIYQVCNAGTSECSGEASAN